jgi:hypothetical protein
VLRIQRFIAMLVFLIIAVLTSGCYTIVGYPPEVEKGIIEEDAAPGQVYREYEYYYDRPYPYYWGYNSYYDVWYPYYHYRDYPWWWDYNDQYVPEKKPETKRRGSSELQRAPQPERKRDRRLEEDEEIEQSSREIRSERGTEDRVQKPLRKSRRASTTGSEKRSNRKSEDEER